MGIDFLDMSFRIEMHLKIQVRQADWESLTGNTPRPDVTVGAVFDLIGARRICRKREHDLRGHPNTAICPNADRILPSTTRRDKPIGKP